VVNFNTHLVKHSSPAYYLTLLVLFLALPFLLSSVFLRRTLKKQLEILSEATKVLEETISNKKIVKAFTGKDYETQRYKRLSGQQRR
jgi:ABC-type multidrug transport system fused ATPase/permease subunit